MLCNLCKKNHATFEKFVPTIGKSVPICAGCLYRAQGISGPGIRTTVNVTETFSTGDGGMCVIKKTISNVPTGIVCDIGDFYKSTGASSASIALSLCENCGMEFGSFKKTGKLGCSECYTAFDKQLGAVIRQIHG